ncbi:MAG: stage II sporulation protein R [Clostridia bacterium]|nr:stage II sporulation protein R [Clostridia bacterium]
MKFQKIMILASVLVLCLAICNILPIHGEEKIYESVVRLHVLANSDSEEDQALKLKVRDAILSHVSPLVIDSKSREEAIEILQGEIEKIEKIAFETVKEQGYDYSVDVTLTLEDYPTRNYEAMSFPSGQYVSLRVLIGEAEGQNWWCVLFPPLCLSAASAKAENEEAFIAVGLNSDQYKIITESEDMTYYLRFKILEAVKGTQRGR